MARLSFRCDEELVKRVDARRGMIPREAWLRWAVEQALSEAKEPVLSEQAGPGSVPSSEGVRLAAPAERPRAAGLFRSSAQAKRDIKPIPKKGQS